MKRSTRFLGASLIAVAALAAGAAAFGQQQALPGVPGPLPTGDPAITPAVGPDGQPVVEAVPELPPLGPVDPADPWVWGDVATLRGLDKVTAETRDFEARVGEDVQFFALTVSVKRCAKRPPERTPETIVGMEVHDRQTDGEGGEAQSNRIFSGWMFGSSPALNPLEHPVYDIWVLDCVDSRIPPPPEPTPEELAAAEAAAEQALETSPLPGQVLD